MRGVIFGKASSPVLVGKVRQGLRAVWPIIVYAACLVFAGVVAITGFDRLAHAVATQHSVLAPVAKGAVHQPPASRILRSAVLIPTNDEWAEKLRDPAFWAKNRAGGSKPASWTKPQNEGGQRLNLGVNELTARAPAPEPRRSKPAQKDNADDSSDSEDTYRTVCVRTCDGAFFPLSFSTSRDHFDADASRCEKSCGSESRMFFYKNPGSELDDMEDRQGRPYKKLPTAFLFKTKYVEACKCRPHPWEDASITRHKVYALEAQQAKGNKSAAVELKDLRAKLKQAEGEAAAEKLRVAQAKLAGQKLLAETAKATKANPKLAAKSDRPGLKPLPADAPLPSGGPVPIAALSALTKQSPVAPEWGPRPPKGQSSSSSVQSRVATDATVIYRVGSTVSVLKPAAQTRIGPIR
jgi:hypothetical protein